MKPFDVSILSTYMGKWFTLIVAVFVLIVTGSAIMMGGPEHNIIRICVDTEVLGADAVTTFESLRGLLRKETRRPVLITSVPEGPCDLYVVSTAWWLQNAEALDLKSDFTTVGQAGVTDQAVLIAAKGDEFDATSLSWRDVIFVSPFSVNGFLVQLALLEDEGLDLPEDPGAAVFAGGESAVAGVFFGVVSGKYRLGACRLSDVTRLTRDGVIGRGDVQVVARRKAMPEVVIACRQDDAAYYRSKLSNVARVLERSGGIGAALHASPDARILRAAGVVGLRPLDPGELKEVRQFAERYATLFGGVYPATP